MTMTTMKSWSIRHDERILAAAECPAETRDDDDGAADWASRQAADEDGDDDAEDGGE